MLTPRQIAMVQSDPSSRSRAARRRYLTLLFSDLSDATRLSRSVEPEQYLEVLDLLKRHGAAIVRKHGGTLVESRGDGLFAMFGYPEPSEYDGRCAAEAALELRDVIARVPAPAGLIPPFLSVHSGIHLGLALLLEDGAGGFEVAGLAANTAARLCERAEANQILVSATTLGTEGDFFEIRDRGELSLQGAGSVATYEVLGRAPIATRYQARVRHGLTPFVGRGRELAVLERALDDAAHGHLQMIAVVGGPGIGKTRLVEEFLQSAAARGCDVHRGYCEDHRSAEPLQPFRQMLRMMSTPPAAGTPPAIRDFFCSLAAARSVVIFIDDWQWADDASRKMLAAIRELVDHRILIVTTSRTMEDDTSLSESEIRLSLGPLDEADVTRAIRALRPAADPFVIRDIHDLSGGNPLYIEELCHSASRQMAEGRADRATRGAAWLSTLIESRVNRLPAEQADLVRTAAIIGRVVPGWLLQQLTGCGEDHPLVRDLAAHDLVFAGDAEGTLRFKHGITRDVIYDSIGLRWREAMHLRVAELVEERWTIEHGDDLLGALAYHYGAAARAVQAADYAERAGDAALAAAALDRARTQYSAALELLEPDEHNYQRWLSIAQRLGLTCVYDASRDQLPFLERAVGVAAARGDAAALARAQYWLGYVYYALGDLSLAIRHCEEARESSGRALSAARAAERTDEAVELGAHSVQVLATLAQARAAACEYDGVLEQFDEAIQIKRRHRRGTRPAVGSAYTLACYGGVLADLGRFRDAHQSFAEALEAVRESNQPVKGSILAWQGAVYAWQHQWADALAQASEAQRIGSRVESLYVLAISQALGGYARWKLEHAPEAIDTMIRAVSWLESRDKRLFISMSYGWVADALAGSGRYGEARAYVARALRRARQRDRFGEAMAYRVMAKMPPEYRHRSADHYFERAMAAATKRQSPHEEAATLREQAEVAGSTGGPSGRG